MAREKDVGEADPQLSPGQAEAIPTWRAAYSDRTAALMAAMSQFAYAARAEGAVEPGDNAVARDRLRASLADGNFRLVSIFGGDTGIGFLAIIEGQLAVLAFRGTADNADWTTNLHVGRVPLPGASGVKVHAGFLAAFQKVREEVEAAVEAHVPATLGLYITGHSLGGALAQIASAALERDNLAACYTFGSPRVGTVTFDREVKCPHYRMVNNWDLVPGVPFPLPMGYAHSGDPRLLLPRTKNQQALRRDRSVAARLVVDLVGLAIGLFSHKTLVIQDHMIWNYRSQLEAIARARAAPLAVRAERTEHPA